MKKTQAPSSPLQDLNLLEDYFLEGFARERGDLPSLAAPVEKQLQELAGQISRCVRCGLHTARTRTVPGEGAVAPLVLVIGEGPGEEEDRSGRPFVGRAGQYLDKWLQAIDLARGRNCFIANIVKCRPPGNRDPSPEESAACLPYLARQIDCLRPRALLCLGRISAQVLLGSSAGIGSLRGRVHAYRDIPLVPTYHPSAVLRDSSLRQAVWDDLKLLRTRFAP